MTRQALGLVEVRGYLGAIVAADAALKAANVSLVNIEPVKAGLNTVHLVGDVGAIKAAVDAGVGALEGLDCYLGSHVIPRPDTQVEILFSKKKVVDEVVEKQENTFATPEEVVESVSVIEENTEVNNEETVKEDVVSETTNQVEETTQVESTKVEEHASSKGYTFEELDKLKVVELRKIAYRRSKIGLTKKEIKFANKQTLIKALLK